MSDMLQLSLDLRRKIQLPGNDKLIKFIGHFTEFRSGKNAPQYRTGSGSDRMLSLNSRIEEDLR